MATAAMRFTRDRRQHDVRGSGRLDTQDGRPYIALCAVGISMDEQINRKGKWK
jgi:hypothetical protein